jgi:GntR family transcriptional repressor for pyruvate dehydrogenase complex
MDDSRHSLARAPAAGGEDDAAGREPLPDVVTKGSAAIATTLQKAILKGAYAYGERLPPERDLAKHYDTSRSTVREALRRLEDLKLVTRRIGSGTYVNYHRTPDGHVMATRTSPIELIEVRLGIEPQMARLAALHATIEDLGRLEAAIMDLEKAGEDRDAFSNADEQFHLRLAECTRNPLMIWLYRHINDIRGHAAWNRMKEKILTPERIAAYNEHHRRIFEAISNRDAESAANIVREHIEKAHQDLLGVEDRD